MSRNYYIKNKYLLSHQNKMEDLLGRLRRYNDGQKRPFPRSRVFRKRLNHLNLRTKDELYERYRFCRPTPVFLLVLDGAQIEHFTKLSCAICSIVQLLVIVRFDATGTFLQEMIDSVFLCTFIKVYRW